jgi:periplasmic protein TonB
MSTGSRNEVFTVSEIARAGGVPTEAVLTLVGRGELSFIAGTQYIAVPSPVRTARLLREAALALQARPAVALFARADSAPPRTRKPAVASLTAHAAVAVLVVLLSMGHTESASIADTPHEESHLVFLMSPGPGGGGGGGGLRQPKPAPKILRKTERPRPQLSVPPAKEAEPIVVAKQEPPPEPEPPKEIVAPVERVAANEVDRVGQIEHAAEAPESNGPGSNGGVGTGQGSGNGEGVGSGIGEGEGGGTGGGPYRPGSGIEPPRLLHEVKAQYTEDARRRGIAGDVLLEVVVRRDGTVGDAHVLHGLGYGLDERAISAVRQWRFAAAQRKGVPVDVLVEVAVEFTLR